MKFAADYKCVFRKLKEILDGNYAVKEIVSDFERATWRSLQDSWSVSKVVFRFFGYYGLYGLFG